MKFWKHFILWEAVKNSLRGGGPSNSRPKAAKPGPPLKILHRTCTPLKMTATVKTPPKFWERNDDPP